jgi:tetratricopeptide (TPR) repeat protein
MLGKDHPFIAITYSSLANLFRTQNKYDDALEYEKMALEICEKKLGIHQNTANAYENLARLYHETDNYQEAFKYFKKAAEVRKKLGSK